MNEFFVIGSEDPSFMNGERITSFPEFQGIVLPQGGTINNRYVPSSHKPLLGKLKTVSLGSFLLYVKKNPGVTLVSCYDFPGGRRYVKKLQEAAKYKFELCDYYNFCLERNAQPMFMPAQVERKIILDSKKEWSEFRKQLTDDFSKLSLDCYLSAYEKKDTSLLLPAYVGFENIFFNRVSRKLSLVPNSSEIYVDAGALDGDTVAAFVDCAGRYRAIHAFEPMKPVYDELKKREFYLENFYPKNMAVSNMTGALNFYVDNRNSYSGSRVIGDYLPEDATFAEVPCTKLDDVLDEATLLKIEVEGHEPAVIEGAANLIKKCKPDMVVHAYHLPLDPIRIVEAVNKAHKYKHVALRFYTVGMHIFSLLFSDRAPFE